MAQKKARKSKINLTDQICNKLDESAPVETQDVYMPKKSEGVMNFVDLVGEDNYFNDGTAKKVKAKKSNPKGKGGSGGDAIALIVTLLGFVAFIIIIITMIK